MFIFLLIVVLMFGAIFTRLSSMQLGQYEDYVTQAETKSQKTFSLTGKRGTIYDASMIPLAYDRVSYNVQFYRDPTHGSEAYRAWSRY
jgi:cell division protein FtsI/penicillin-binding protein 2